MLCFCPAKDNCAVFLGSGSEGSVSQKKKKKKKKRAVLGSDDEMSKSSASEVGG